MSGKRYKSEFSHSDCFSKAIICEIKNSSLPPNYVFEFSGKKLKLLLLLLVRKFDVQLIRFPRFASFSLSSAFVFTCRCAVHTATAVKAAEGWSSKATKNAKNIISFLSLSDCPFV